MSSGKQKDQDWFLHCNIFDQIINNYKAKIPGFRKIIVWTDGAPNQYKCRQNFYWLSKVHELFGIKIIHRFAATAQFKGVHDKIGQVAKWTVKYNSLLYVVFIIYRKLHIFITALVVIIAAGQDPREAWHCSSVHGL